jgi:hypothetical protein
MWIWTLWAVNEEATKGKALSGVMQEVICGSFNPISLRVFE